MKKLYLFFILGAIVAHGIAAGTTWYAIEVGGHREGNPISASLFSNIGYFWTWIVQTIYIAAILILVPYVTFEHKKIGWMSMVICGAFFSVMLLDAINNILVILNHPMAWWTGRTIDLMATFLGYKFG